MSDVQFEEEGNTIGNRVMYSNAQVEATPKLEQLVISSNLARDVAGAKKILLVIAFFSFILTVIVIKVFLFPSSSDLTPAEKAQLPRHMLEQLQITNK